MEKFNELDEKIFYGKLNREIKRQKILVVIKLGSLQTHFIKNGRLYIINLHSLKDLQKQVIILMMHIYPKYDNCYYDRLPPREREILAESLYKQYFPAREQNTGALLYFRNSCFLDSLLVALFNAKNIMEAIFNCKKVDYSHSKKVNGNLSEREISILMGEIREEFISINKRLKNGESFYCKKLRGMLSLCDKEIGTGQFYNPTHVYAVISYLFGLNEKMPVYEMMDYDENMTPKYPYIVFTNNGALRSFGLKEKILDGYRLVSAIVLHGTIPGMDGGVHYTTYLYNGGEYFHYDDMKGEYSSVEKFPQSVFEESPGIKPALLIYEKS